MSEEEYYTASEAIARLGMARATFFREVDAGNIPKYTPPGHRRGIYQKSFIDALASARQMIAEHMRYTGVPHFEFSKSTPAQQKEEMDIGIAAFGEEFITPLDQRMSFQLKSPYTFWSLKVFDPALGRYRVVAYLSTFRFPEPFLDSILEGTNIERDITLDQVLRFEKHTPFDVYIDVLATSPDLPDEVRHWYGYVIVRRFANELLNLLSNGFEIRTMYTITTSPEGDRLVKGLGFQHMIGKSKAKGRIAYKYDLDEAGIEQLQKLSSRGEQS